VKSCPLRAVENLSSDIVKLALFGLVRCLYSVGTRLRYIVKYTRRSRRQKRSEVYRKGRGVSHPLNQLHIFQSASSSALSARVGGRSQLPNAAFNFVLMRGEYVGLRAKRPVQ